MQPTATRTSTSAGTPAVCVAVVAAVLFGAILQRHLTDDAYITLSYARNFAEHLHWGIVPGRTANTATSPLNVLLLAGLIRIFPGGAVFATGVLYVLSVTATFLAVRRLVNHDGGRSRSATAWALTVTGLIELNPIMQSSAGLETAMFIAILAWLTVAAQSRSAVWFGVLAGALILTRPDGVLFAAVLIVPFVRSVRRLLIVVTLAILIPGSWAVVSWFWLGSAVPDTVSLKRYQQPWDGHSFGTGLVLLGKHYPLGVGAAVAIPTVCVVALVVARIFARPIPTRSERSVPPAALQLPASRPHGNAAAVSVHDLRHHRPGRIPLELAGQLPVGRDELLRTQRDTARMIRSHPGFRRRPAATRMPNRLGAQRSLAARIVNAIPAVVEAPPGISTTLYSPLITGKGLYAR